MVPGAAAVLLLLLLGRGPLLVQALDSCLDGSCQDVGDGGALLQVPRRSWAQLGEGLTGNESLATDLAACLSQVKGQVYTPQSYMYDQARQCANMRPDLQPTPKAVVQALGDADVQEAVKCARRFKLKVCAKAGSHGYSNDAGCSGGVQVDLKELTSFSVNVGARTAKVGAGHTNGQLYWKLGQHNLAFPGGTVAGVGISGLTLGCGRGMLTFAYGLACDSILGFRYVNAQGDVKEADSNMLWFAKGGGGEFPGIVVEWNFKVYPMPKKIYALQVAYSANHAQTVLTRWFAKCDEMDERNIYTAVEWWSAGPDLPIILTIKCNGCTSGEQQWAKAVAQHIGSGLECNLTESSRDYLDEVYTMSGGYQKPSVVPGGGPPDFRGLLNWDVGWGKKPQRDQSYVTGRMGYSWSMSQGQFQAFDRWTRQKKVEPWVLLVIFLPVGGTKGTGEERTRKASQGSYGHDTALWNVEIRYLWPTSQSADYNARIMQHAQDFQRALDPHMPCKNLYNYIDPKMTCATTNDAWLEAYFLDVPRMKRLKQEYDPAGVFRSRLGGGGGGTGPPPPSPTPSPSPARDTDGCTGYHDFDCRSTKCCSTAGARCYQKNQHWAACLDSCSPGVLAGDPDPSPWSCRDLTA